MSGSLVDLSIIVPAYNEESQLADTLDRIRGFLEGRPASAAEVIIVDDGSRDGTARLVRAAAIQWPAVRLVRLPRNHGKGAAVRAGVAAATGDLIAFVDADLSADLQLLAILLDDLGTVDVAIASRAIPGARLLRRQSLPRESLAKLYAKLVGLLLLRGIPDAHCGLKAFRRDAARSIFALVREDRSLFDCEAMLVAALQQRPMTQRPVTWSHRPDTRVPMTPREVLTIATGFVRLKVRHRSLRPPRARDLTPNGER